MAQEPQMKPPRIDVIELATRKIVHSVQLHSTQDRYVERVMSGMLKQVDTERFVLEEVLR